MAEARSDTEATAPSPTAHSAPIEDYALIGDLATAALVRRDGSIDWLCLPRFDSPACFAALLGTEENGCWLLQPRGEILEIQRRYRDATLILETEFRTATGTVVVTDLMPQDGSSERTDIIRLVTGVQGSVEMHTDLALRFDYGRVVPWVRRSESGLIALAGPDAIRIQTPVELHGEDLRTRATFQVQEGETIPFVLTAFRSHLAPPAGIDPHQMLEATERWWRSWSEQCHYQGPWREAVIRSLVTLKALIHQPTGGIVAAPTTSLPELLGGSRNWDYRYTWIRDASFTLYSLLISGHRAEARAWREWLLRAVAGSPEQLQTLYGVAGERRLTEFEIPGLPGYAGSRPVRVGNDASNQLQLDVYGELMDAFHVARRHEVAPLADAWSLQRHLLDFLESNWEQADESIWEIRGTSRQFTYSKVMAWVAMDRAVQAHERFGLDGEVDRWRALRDTIHADVCRKGYDPERESFVQYYGGRSLDASLLLIPLMGFLPATDPRVTGTVRAIQRELLHDGLVLRYDTGEGVDGLEGREGAFLACSFWLADNLAMSGQRDEARKLFERLLSLRNDVGLLAEEYDPVAKRLLGNFPQAFSHVSLINSAWNLEGQRAHRTDCPGPAPQPYPVARSPGRRGYPTSRSAAKSSRYPPIARSAGSAVRIWTQT